MTHPLARGRLRPGQMNKLETSYAQLLEARRAAGELLWWKFEAIKLRLADRTFFSPDFFLMTADHELQVHETKGYMQDDANVKLKVAASIYPFRFLLARWVRKEWHISEI